MKTRDRKKNEKLIKCENALINQIAWKRRGHIPVHKQTVNEVRGQRLCTQKGVSYLVHGKRSFSAYQGQVNWGKETLSARDWVMKTSETPMG